MENEEYRKEQRRALNMIWMAAEDYTFRPAFMSFDRTGHAVFYLNTLIGLTQKWFGQDLVAQKAADFEGAALRELYDTVLWLCLESCIYKKELPFRPVIKELREEYARQFLKDSENILEPTLALLLRIGYFKRILGQKPSMTAREKRLFHAMDLDGNLNAEQVKASVEQILWEFYRFRSAPLKKKNVKAIRIPVPAFIRNLHVIPVMMVRADNKVYGEMADLPGRGEKSDGAKAEEGTDRFLVDFSASGREACDKQYIRNCFGPPLYGEPENRRLEKELCTGNHQNCRLYFAGAWEQAAGPEMEGRPSEEIQNSRKPQMSRKRKTAETPESYWQQKRFQDQERKNREYYNARQELFRNCVLQLRNRLLDAMQKEEAPETVLGMSGRLEGSLIWRSLHLEDNRIFIQNRMSEKEPFSVDIMLDGSASQLERQEVITAQAYVIAESLRLCGIPAQVYSFCSIRGYTVFRVFRSYGDRNGNGNIFRYAAAGWNRDGLALRGAGHLAEQSPCQKRVLLVLTDASPNDDKRLASKGHQPLGREYAKAAGIRDAAKEVQRLKKKGIRVIGLFCGHDGELPGAGKIYGSSFARIADMGQLAGTVGGLILREVLRED